VAAQLADSQEELSSVSKYTSRPHTSSSHGILLIKHRDNFNLFFFIT
jgi:hypothetical protein